MPSIENRPTEDVLAETRTALAREPDMTVSALRALLRISTDRARAVHQAVRWEVGYRATRGLSREQLDREFRELVQSSADPESTLNLEEPVTDAGRELESALEQIQRAYTRAMERVRVAAVEQLTVIRQRASADVAAAHEDIARMATDVDLYTRQSVEAQADTARLRAESDGRVRELERDVRDAERATERALEKARSAMLERDATTEKLEKERLTMRTRETEWQEQHFAHQQLLGRTDAEANALRAQVRDLQHRLTSASMQMAEAQAELVEMSKRAAVAEARLDAGDAEQASTKQSERTERRRPRVTTSAS